MNDIKQTNEQRAQAREALEDALFEIKRVIVGQDAMLERLLPTNPRRGDGYRFEEQAREIPGRSDLVASAPRGDGSRFGEQARAPEQHARLAVRVATPEWRRLSIWRASASVVTGCGLAKCGQWRRLSIWRASASPLPATHADGFAT